ncbi:MAG: hypothetical protein J6W00_15000 [Lentisphaeria bacterium]|nr:hypothetical protein [Lentisphaeria bacterium]
MSYARTPEVFGTVFANAVNSLKASKKYHGYSILAGEHLLDALKSMPPPRVSARRATDYVALLKELYPAYHYVMTRSPRWKKSQQGKAVSIMQNILERHQRVRVTFEGNTFLCSSTPTAIAYLRGVIHPDAWDRVPNCAIAYQRMEMYGGRAVFTYGENEAIIERVSQHGNL